MSDDEDNQGLSLDSVFTEEPRPPSPEPTFAVYRRRVNDSDPDSSSSLAESTSWAEIEIKLVGSHPLWGHYLWNASRSFASYLDQHTELFRDKNVLELGAGGGLPGIVTALDGARYVVLTDYPDASLIDNLKVNVDRNVPAAAQSAVHVTGYIWGHDVDPLLQQLQEGEKFHLIILSDLVFNHSQHDALLKTCDLALAERPTSPTSSASSSAEEAGPCVLVFYTHHRPHLADRDMQFFEKARERRWRCEEILTERFPPMFPDDPGEEEVRSTVHGWRLTRMQ
ncbi:hypothetical protein PUNSTDRAFT_76907 [Punctularia strigosozonata HHB-11173 SS5]|uniref:Protein N-terminal and lysine N-methyltransferase EFM7 n=1 Tax=Punctularia strigosozonata (strain HHB-11173) TaxID=741275 RepID=R7S4Q6_PUNST|nr:uncharacterized protein PUNSTDRAFT_76907 [Punctularia strigosozonata HHB-11173 SS5]EIN04216.1 hypothetical protein PUNSTDRAFT_76907 [Punctularia strigosozonata HHB-11173 SS5]